jgi:glycine C-acetyltransferase
MDGYMAALDRNVELADRYDAMVMVDDSHATGFVGESGRGSAEYHAVTGQIDIYTSTLGKALGGGSGGYTAGRREIIELLRQRSRPYLFSNALAPSLVAAGIKALELVARSSALRERLWSNTRYFRSHMVAAGFDIKPGEHPIVPIMIYDAALAQRMAQRLLEEGIYVVAFSYPVVPQEQARIRAQISAAHSRAHLDQAIAAFLKVGRECQLIS